MTPSQIHFKNGIRLPVTPEDVEEIEKRDRQNLGCLVTLFDGLKINISEILMIFPPMQEKLSPVDNNAASAPLPEEFVSGSIPESVPVA